MPPYTTSSSGFSATPGSRLFINIRIGASVNQLLQVNVVPVGALILRAPSVREFVDTEVMFKVQSLLEVLVGHSQLSRKTLLSINSN